ncbi:hypothetical protein [Rubrivivax albus]|uniref:Uncharacterized protein n=1 Tax=Rubrivivax albus TaxID=2499835 RepID=A0A3S2WPR8_9BURK|nr:hypothetical protein [Rubrivivax albus]RVT47685.1 hypothetical protein ENE75_24005 [Rubrivivax albus]
MKTFSRAAGVALLAILALQGCAINPSVSAGSSIEEFARGLNGKRYMLDVSGGSSWVPSMSGAPVAPNDFPKGFVVALAPAEEHCRRGGGTPSFAAIDAPFPRGRLPVHLLCAREAKTLWLFELQYVDAEFSSNRTHWIATVLTRTLPTEQADVRLRELDARAEAADKAAAAQRARQATLEQERQQRARAQEAEAQRLAAEWPARVAAFQANLKAGDRFQWASAPGGGGPYVGMVVRIEGVMAFVQFDNLTISGQSTRYLPKGELEPFDGPTPAWRRSID